MNTTEEITSFINAIRELSGIGICYYDLNSFFNYDKYGVQSNRGHYCAFCEKARSLPGGREGCTRSDKSEAIILAKQYKEPFFFECHMGMRELVIPLMREEALLGILFVGQCRTEESDSSRIASSAKRLMGNPNEFVRLYEQLPLISQKNLLNVGTILSEYFDIRIWNNELLAPSATSRPSNQDLAEAINNFIRLNYRYKLSPKEIANELHVNASYASRRFSQHYKKTITEQITDVRINRAKMLLSETNAPVGNIALNVGFDDVNYFSRVFKKETGYTPSQYRKLSTECTGISNERKMI